MATPTASAATNSSDIGQLAEEDDMTLTNLRVVNDEPRNQRLAHAAIESYNAKSQEGAVSRGISIPKGRHLDVDEVLARSLPKVAGE